MIVEALKRRGLSLNPENDRNPSAPSGAPSANPPPQGSAADGVALRETAEGSHLAFQGQVFTNTQTNVIQITEDKAHLALQKLSRRSSLDGLVAPLGIGVSLAAVLVSASFKTKELGVAADVWHAGFVIATVVVGVWLIGAIINRLFRGGQTKAIASCIEEMKGPADNVTLKTEKHRKLR